MNKFCLVPWYGKEFQRKSNLSTTACCWLPKSSNLDNIKKEFLQGGTPHDCQRCWHNEDHGLVSRRLIENSYYIEKLNQPLDHLIDSCQSGQASPLFYQISLSNLCNQACVTCNGASSTRWQSLDPAPYHTYFSKDLDILDVDWKNAKRISILGGEPLYDPKTYELLDKLLSHGNTNCDIVFVTNGSVAINEKQKDLFKQFNTQVSVSIDGTENLFEYLRWPGKWTALLENLQSYRSIFSDVNVSYTISTLNFWDHKKTVLWFKSQKFNYNFNFVQYPPVFSIQCMPEELKARVPNDHPLKGMIKITGDEVSMDTLRDEIVRQDKIKKISLKDYLPDVYDLIFVDS